jgi:glutathione S-transferase
MRGSRWPAIERWMAAFEAMPTYMATKSDYYTHIKDIPPQYGPGYSLPGSEKFASVIGETSRDLHVEPVGRDSISSTKWMN